MDRRKRKTQHALKDLAAWSKTSPTRPRITREQVIQGALKVLDEEGFEGLTMRRLAEQLGIKAASLYNHVSDKDELLALLADALFEEAPEPDPGKSWREQLEAMARYLRRVLLAHRDGARVLAATPPLGPNRLRLIEQLLHTLISAGFSATEAANAGSVFNSYVVGFVLDETLGNPQETTSFQRVQEEVKSWFQSLPKEQYPTLVALADDLVSATPEQRFGFGVRVLLDGFEHRLSKKEG